MTKSLLRVLRGLCGLTALVTGALACGSVAHGFQPETVGSFNIHWNGSDFPLVYHINPVPVTGVSAADWMRNWKYALRTWAQEPASNVTFAVVGTTTIATPTQSDNTNVLFSVNSGWSTGTGILALTYYYGDPSNGHFLGTDTDFDGTDFTFSTAYLPESGYTAGDTAYDLQAIMAHEAGHAIGFGESIDNTGVNPGDPNYDPGPPPQINGPLQNTEDPATLPGETYQRSLAPDDIDALTATYPTSTTVLTKPSAFLVKPDGVNDAPSGSTYTIQWLGQYGGSGTPTVSFYYTKNVTDAQVAGLTGATLIASGITCPTNGSLASYTWTFNNVPAGSYYIIAVATDGSITTTDLSPGVVTVSAPVLALTAPTSTGITMNPYDTYTATWTSSGEDLGAVRLDLSIDGGATFTHSITNATANTGSYSFSVPDPVKAFGSGPQTQCVLKVSYVANSSASAQSTNPFTIALASDSLTVTAPNGGEFLTAGAVTPLTFNASGSRVGDNFRIQFSPDMGTTWYEVEHDISITGANPRTYAWKVPGAVGDFNLVRVTSVNAPFFTDSSDSPFTIGSGTPSAFTVVPADLTFEVSLSGPSPENQDLTVTNAQAGTGISGLTTSSSNVRITTPGAPTAILANVPATIPVAIANTFPSAGTYTETLTLHGSGVADLTVPVTINVEPAGTILPLTFTPSSLSFVGTPGGLAPGGQSLSVGNPAGNVQTTVELSTTNSRLLVSPGRFGLTGGGSQTVAVLSDTTNLPSGTFTDSLVQSSATQIGAGSFAVTTTVTGVSSTGVRSKEHASPCALLPGAEGADAGGSSGAFFGLLVALLGLAVLRRRYI
ncbi:MAG: hypothetical protein ACREJ2_02590 [Planctomycetota bacterium]